MRLRGKAKSFQQLAKIKAAVKAHPLKNIRRAFRGFSTEEARTFVVRMRGKRLFCRVDRTKCARYLAEERRLLLDLFHRLYPKNSLTPVGVMKVPARAILGYYPEEFEVSEYMSRDPLLRARMERSVHESISGLAKYPVFGVVTEIERRQSPDFKVYQREVRGDVERFSPASNRHKEFIQVVALPLANRILKESGIRVDYPGNISNVNGNPLFFEPKITAPKRLVEFIKTKPAKERVALMKIVRALGLS
jgi:hypothetical protein